MKASLISPFTLSVSIFALPVPQDTSSTPSTIQNATAGSVLASLSDLDRSVMGVKRQNGGGPPNSPLNALLAAVGTLPIVGAATQDIGDLLTTVEATLAAALGIQTTENEAGCTAMTVIFARGTTEPG